MRSTFNLFKRPPSYWNPSPSRIRVWIQVKRTTSDPQIPGLQCQLAPSACTPSSPFPAAQLPHALESLDRHLNPFTPPQRSPCSYFRGREPFPRLVSAAAPWLTTEKKKRPVARRPEGDPLPAARLGISPMPHTRLIPG